MEYRKLGLSDLEVSAVGLGTWALGNDYFGEVDDAESIAAIQAGLDAGINLIDTAPAYGAGHAEEIVGKAIQGRRDQVVVATKAGVIRTKDDFIKTLKPESIRKEIDDSLRRLNVDVIDLYQIHWPDPKTPLEDALEEFVKIREQGKYRYLGVSNFSTQEMDKAREMAGIVSLQPQYSLLKRKIENNILPYCRKYNLGVLSYGTLAGGILTGKYREIPEFEEGDNRADFYPFFKEPTWSKVQKFLDVPREMAEKKGLTVAQLAINWTLSQAGITSALVGAKHPKQAQENAAAGDLKLSARELDRIEEATTFLR